MIRRLLVANRGEIAIRIARTARAMGIRTIGVFSAADRGALHVAAMDEAYELGPADPSESYLHAERILDAARRGQADAVHPGYGFLAENADFATRCEEAGLVFVGPPAKALRLCGDKIASRRSMAHAGVPITPGRDRVVTTPVEAREVAAELGYPVLFKATAGGGGIGMARVDRPADIPAAFEAARSVARANFGRPDVFLEAYVERARHIEVQVLVGPRGAAIHLGERECSVQRRHQKLVEETPSVALGPRERARIGETAAKGLAALGYRGAGTVEFLFKDGRFTFNEVNARLQVEHPVTEAVTGLDLVRQQIRIASGDGPEVSQSEVRRTGHALECRINAEDPLRNFLPSPGRIVEYREPAGPRIRVDSGVAAGSAVPPMYDPLVAKLIVHGRNRLDSVRRMRSALDGFVIRGIRTTIPFHGALLRHPRFVKGALWTTMVSDLRIAESLRSRGPQEVRVAAIAAALATGRAVEALRDAHRFVSAKPHAWALAGRRDQLAGGARAVPPRRRR
jgi:acetyl/propionyl-CoA carboxylase alpha subunit